MAPRKLPVLQAPGLAEVVFEPAHPLGDRKACCNCGLYVNSEPSQYRPFRCALHGPLEIPWDSVCAYHVAGKAMSYRTADALRITPLDPQLSGLERVREGGAWGASCDRCQHYVATGPYEGTCQAILHQPRVAARACCARWVRAVGRSW